MVCGILCSTAWADVTIWINAENAPHVYAFDYDNIADDVYKAWPGKTLETSTTVNGEKWWLCALSGTTSTSIIINNGNSGNGNQTPDITNLTSGTYYFVYFGNNSYLDATQAKDAAAYAFLKPNNGSVEWDKDGARLAVDGKEMIKNAGFYDDSNIYLWTSDTEKTGKIKFERYAPDFTTVWNSFEADYYKGTVYWPTDWNVGTSGDNSIIRNLTFPTGIAHDANNFPDDNFHSYLSATFSTQTADGFWTEDELQSVTELEGLGNRNIGSLKGIEYFTELTKLYCNNGDIFDDESSYETKLTELDLSKNTKLTILFCKNNNLSSLDLSNNTTLSQINCADNQLQTLNVTNCTALLELNCADNQLQSLDVTNCTALKSISCYNNQLNTLDLSNNTALKSIGCSNNQLISLSLSQNMTNLKSLSCHFNNLTSLDVSSFSNLHTLICHDNQITTLNLPGSTNSLTYLWCSNNQIGSLNTSNYTMLKQLICSNNHLETIDLSQNTNLQAFFCDNNNLSELNLTYNTNLSQLRCGANRLSTLDLTNNTSLSELNCEGNNIAYLDLRLLTKLKRLKCQNNKLTMLDLTKQDFTSSELPSLSPPRNAVGPGGGTEIIPEPAIPRDPIGFTISPQTVYIGKVYSFKSGNKTYYFIWLDDEYKENDKTFVDIVTELEGLESSPINMDLVTWGSNCEKFSGTAQNNSNTNAPRLASLSDGLNPSHITGDILLIDPESEYFTYNYLTNNEAEDEYDYNMPVNVYWSPTSITTGVDGVKGEASPVSVRYINLSGVGSDTPWDGVNIVVTKMDNGLNVITKEVR